MITGSKELIRNLNTRLVIRTVLKEGPISRAALASRLGLTKATISSIVQSLLDAGLLIEIGNEQTKKGRKPILLKLNADCGHILSIDLSPEYITLLTSNLAGEHCALKRTVNHTDRETILPRLISLITQSLAVLPPSPYGLVGISLGLHGVVHENRPVFIPYSPYSGIDFATALQEKFHCPVQLENEANLSVLGEHAFAFSCENLVNISVHAGIGLGIYMKGQLLKGQDGYAGEFGHSIIQIRGRQCPCGNRGCLEQYASETALLKELSQKKGRQISIEEFAVLYQKKDADALSTADDFVTYLSVGVNNILQILNPEMIVINSAFTMYFPQLCQQITDCLANSMKKHCRLVPSRLQDTAILLGGVTLIRDYFLEHTERLPL